MERRKEREMEREMEAPTRRSANAAFKSADMHARLLKVREMDVKAEHPDKNGRPNCWNYT